MMLRGSINTLFAVAALVVCATPHLRCQDQNNHTETDTMETHHGDQYAVIKTTLGDMEVELFSEATPVTVSNFVGLAERGYYNGVLFHRVIRNFMIQGGDPTGTGRGGESFTGKPFADEFVDSLRHDRAGILSMANKGPNTNSSQFFITLVPTPWLDGHHTIFGRVVRGMDVLEAIGKVPTDPSSNRPLTDVIITSVTIVKKEDPEKKNPH
jgi:cyclophilin family peptidyl-prolyl cis-trans isomerase